MEKQHKDDAQELDPRIQIELEKLNKAAEKTNELERKFGEAQNVFKEKMTEASQELKCEEEKVGIKHIERSRPYYEALKRAKIAKVELERATEDLNATHARYFSSKRRVSELEQTLSGGNKDHTLLEMLNEKSQEFIQVTHHYQLYQGCYAVILQLAVTLLL